MCGLSRRIIDVRNFDLWPWGHLSSGMMSKQNLLSIASAAFLMQDFSLKLSVFVILASLWLYGIIQKVLRRSCSKCTLKIMLESNVPGCEGRSLARQKKVTKPTTMKTALEILDQKLVFLQGNIRQAFTKRRDLLVLRSS